MGCKRPCRIPVEMSVELPWREDTWVRDAQSALDQLHTGEGGGREAERSGSWPGCQPDHRGLPRHEVPDQGKQADIREKGCFEAFHVGLETEPSAARPTQQEAVSESGSKDPQPAALGTVLENDQ